MNLSRGCLEGMSVGSPCWPGISPCRYRRRRRRPGLLRKSRPSCSCMAKRDHAALWITTLMWMETNGMPRRNGCSALNFTDPLAEDRRQGRESRTARRPTTSAANSVMPSSDRNGRTGGTRIAVVGTRAAAIRSAIDQERRQC